MDMYMVGIVINSAVASCVLVATAYVLYFNLRDK